MNMVEVKVDELSGPALDWAVAQAIGQCLHERIRIMRYNDDSDHICEDCGKDTYTEPSRATWKISADWSQGGPLIDKYRPDIQSERSGGLVAYINNNMDHPDPLVTGHGDTYLIAACRAIVAAKLGDTVQIPAELLQ